MHNFDGRYLQVIERAGRGCKISAGSICKSWKEQVEDAKFLRGVSAKYRKSRLRMRNFCREYLQGIENVGCRCKICEGSILKSKKSKLQMHWSQKEHLQQRISKPCRYIGPKKSICNSEYQGIADTSDTRKANLLIVPHISITVHLPGKKKTMQSSELESGLPDEAEQECIVFFLPERLP